MKSEPLGGPSYHWTIAAADNAYLIGLLLLTFFHFWLSAYLPPAEDELYYWAWSQHLQGSYFDHPPMVAILIAISTKIFGNTLFGIRFFSTVAALFILWAIRKIADRPSMLIYLWFTPMFLVGAILMTPDTPFLVFWTCYLIWLILINGPLSEWSGDPVARVYHKSPVGYAMWAVGGIALGLGFLSKYTMALAAPCSLIVLWSQYRRGAWIRGYLFHLLFAFIVTLPVLIFNIEHHFASFHFQWNNAMEGSGGFALYRLWQFLGGQIVLIGALPFLMLPWVLIHRQELSEDRRMHICFYFFVLPLLFFLFQSLRTKLEANWALACYLAFFPMAQWLLDRSSFKTFGQALVFASFSIPIVFSLLLLVHLVSPLKMVTPRKDRVSRMKAQYLLSQTIGSDLKKATDTPVFAPTYQWTSYLRFQKVPAEQIYPGSRMSQFTLAPKNACTLPVILLLSESPDGGSAKDTLKCFNKKETVKTYPLIVRTETVETYYLLRYSR